MKVIKAMTIMHDIKEINILYTQSVLADCLNHLFSTYPAELSVPLFASLIIMSLLHVCIFSFDLMLHMILRLTRTKVFNPQCKYWFIFVTWNFFL